MSTGLNNGDLLRSAVSKKNGIVSAGTIEFEVDLIANCGDERKFFTSIIEKIFLDFKILPYEQVGM